MQLQNKMKWISKRWFHIKDYVLKDMEAYLKNVEQEYQRWNIIKEYSNSTQSKSIKGTRINPIINCGDLDNKKNGFYHSLIAGQIVTWYCNFTSLTRPTRVYLREDHRKTPFNCSDYSMNEVDFNLQPEVIQWVHRVFNDIIRSPSETNHNNNNEDLTNYTICSQREEPIHKRIIDIQCDDNANDIKHHFNKWVVFSCPGDCEKQGRKSNVYGNKVYHYKSSLCLSAIHSGIDGRFKIEPKERDVTVYEGIQKNGIRSDDYVDDNKGHLSFTVIPDYGNSVVYSSLIESNSNDINMMDDIIKMLQKNMPDNNPEHQKQAIKLLKAEWDVSQKAEEKWNDKIKEFWLNYTKAHENEYNKLLKKHEEITQGLNGNPINKTTRNVTNTPRSNKTTRIKQSKLNYVSNDNEGINAVTSSMRNNHNIITTLKSRYQNIREITNMKRDLFDSNAQFKLFHKNISWTNSTSIKYSFINIHNTLSSCLSYVKNWWLHIEKFRESYPTSLNQKEKQYKYRLLQEYNINPHLSLSDFNATSVEYFDNFTSQWSLCTNSLSKSLCYNSDTPSRLMLRNIVIDNFKWYLEIDYRKSEIEIVFRYVNGFYYYSFLINSKEFKISLVRRLHGVDEVVIYRYMEEVFVNNSGGFEIIVNDNVIIINNVSDCDKKGKVKVLEYKDKDALRLRMGKIGFGIKGSGRQSFIIKKIVLERMGVLEDKVWKEGNNSHVGAYYNKTCYQENYDENSLRNNYWYSRDNNALVMSKDNKITFHSKYFQAYAVLKTILLNNGVIKLSYTVTDIRDRFNHFSFLFYYQSNKQYYSLDISFNADALEISYSVNKIKNQNYETWFTKVVKTTKSLIYAKACLGLQVMNDSIWVYSNGEKVLNFIFNGAMDIEERRKGWIGFKVVNLRLEWTFFKVCSMPAGDSPGNNMKLISSTGGNIDGSPRNSNTICLNYNTTSSQNKYCRIYINNEIHKEQCLKSFCDFCCEHEPFSIISTTSKHPHCVKTCKLTTITNNNNNSSSSSHFPESSTETSKCIFNPTLYTLCYQWDNWSKQINCKSDMCHWCCSSWKKISTWRYSFPSIQQCYDECNKYYK